MKFSCIGALAVTLLATERCQAFAPEVIKKAGGGVTTRPPGDLSIFDPDASAKLQGTGDLAARLARGASFRPAPRATTVDRPPAGAETKDAQHFLERGDVPLNFAKPSAPAVATVLGRARLIAAEAPGDIEHVVLRVPDGFRYVEGQSLSVIPPGVAANGRKHKPRLYSIASTRYGDVLDGQTVSLCVRRAEYYDPETGLADPAKKGVCSNFLCSVEPGEEVAIAGPVGKTSECRQVAAWHARTPDDGK